MGNDQPILYSDFVASIFNLYGQRRGKPLVIDTPPRYARSIRTSYALWPHAKFVHIIRDGHDVCLSVLIWEKAARTLGRFASWREDPVTMVTLWWKTYLRLGRRVTRPEPLPRNLLRVPWSRRAGRVSFERTHPAMPVTAGFRDWRTQMPAVDTERFEAAAGDFLEELGYPRTVPRPQPEALRHASKIRDSFAPDVRYRGRLLLECWDA